MRKYVVTNSGPSPVSHDMHVITMIDSLPKNITHINMLEFFQKDSYISVMFYKIDAIFEY